jgi:hypothetical protein
MAENPTPIERNTTEARAGATPGMTRYILSASLVLVIVAFILVYMFA